MLLRFIPHETLQKERFGLSIKLNKTLIRNCLKYMKGVKFPLIARRLVER